MGRLIHSKSKKWGSRGSGGVSPIMSMSSLTFELAPQRDNDEKTK